MSLFSYIRSIYQLDTLDARFTNSSTTPYRRPVNAQVDPTYAKSSQYLPQGVPVKLDSNGRPIAQPSKWNTPEFYFYYFVFLTIVPYMFWVAYDVSQRRYPNHGYCASDLTVFLASDPNYKKYEHLLSPGWVPGRKIVRRPTSTHIIRSNSRYRTFLIRNMDPSERKFLIWLCLSYFILFYDDSTRLYGQFPKQVQSQRTKPMAILLIPPWRMGMLE
jgi:protein-cysteine N-palmitoyltransferase HHAT